VAAIGAFLYGFDLVIISGVQIFLRQQFTLTPTQYGFATSSAILGCIAGPSLGAWLCDRIGRKTTLMLSGVLFLMGAIGAGLAPNILTFNLFRITGGVGVGLSSLASPMYIAEVSPARQRGRLGIMFQLAIMIGAVAATIAAFFLAKYTPATISWRLMLVSVGVPVLVFMALLVRVPQSPRWLAEKGRIEEAFSILARIDGEEFAHAEMKEIRESLNAESGTFAELFEPGMRRALLTGIALALFNNSTGWSGINYYLPSLFQQAGYPQASSAIGVNVLIMTGIFLLTFVSIWLVDRSGRRPIWNITTAAMVVCLGVAGAVFQLKMTGAIVVAAIFLCSIPHAIGLGPLPWLMMSELYPTRIRARAVSISTTFLWIVGFAGPFAFPMIEAESERQLGSRAGIFWFYAVIALLAFLWGRKYLPETKGRTLEEIAESWTRHG
jgi:SP family arabinose:H+ symporter-like MFS transporter